MGGVAQRSARRDETERDRGAQHGAEQQYDRGRIVPSSESPIVPGRSESRRIGTASGAMRSMIASGAAATGNASPVVH